MNHNHVEDINLGETGLPANFDLPDHAPLSFQIRPEDTDPGQHLLQGDAGNKLWQQIWRHAFVGIILSDDGLHVAQVRDPAYAPLSGLQLLSFAGLRLNEDICAPQSGPGNLTRSKRLLQLWQMQEAWVECVFAAATAGTENICVNLQIRRLLASSVESDLQILPASLQSLLQTWHDHLHQTELQACSCNYWTEYLDQMQAAPDSMIALSSVEKMPHAAPSPANDPANALFLPWQEHLQFLILGNSLQSR